MFQAWEDLCCHWGNLFWQALYTPLAFCPGWNVSEEIAATTCSFTAGIRWEELYKCGISCGAVLRPTSGCSCRIHLHQELPAGQATLALKGFSLTCYLRKKPAMKNSLSPAVFIVTLLDLPVAIHSSVQIWNVVTTYGLVWMQQSNACR